MNFATARPRRRTPDLWTASAPARKAVTTKAVKDTKATTNTATKAADQPPVVPEVRLPSTGEEMEALDLEQLNACLRIAIVRLGKVKRRRSRLLAKGNPDIGHLHSLNGKQAELGALVTTMNSKISSLRRAERIARGKVPGLDEAVLRACESQLPEPLFERVMCCAQQIITSCERDVHGDAGNEQAAAE